MRENTEGESGHAKRLSDQPPRTYELPGGPYAASLGPTEVKVLSEISRGGDLDTANRRRGR